MKNFDLASYGVVEMSQQDTQLIDGGIFGIDDVFVAGILIGICIAEMLDRNAGEDFNEGRQAAKDFWN
jgi:hypothetical protein